MSANEEKLQELYMEFQMLTQNLKMLENQQQMLISQMLEIEQAIKHIGDLSKLEGESEILLPISSGVFAKATLAAPKKMLVNVGSNIVVSKDIKDTQKLMESQLNESQEFNKKILSQMEKFSNRAEMIQGQLQAMIPRDSQDR